MTPSDKVFYELRVLSKSCPMAEVAASWPSNQLLDRHGSCVCRIKTLSQQRLGCTARAVGSGYFSNSGISLCRFGSNSLGVKTIYLSALNGQNPLRRYMPDGPKQLSSGMTIKAFSDPELHFVLQLASDAELQELSNILYGRSLLSPLVKSLAIAAGSSKRDHGELRIKQDDRDAFLSQLESRFLFLAADAKSTLSGRRPTYRSVLLQVRKKLNVPCSAELTSEDLESEIFLYLLQQSSRKSIATTPASQEAASAMPMVDGKDAKAKSWRRVLSTTMKLRGQEMLSTILKGGGVMTVSTLHGLVFKKLSKKLLIETAKYQLAKEAVVKTGQAAAMLETRVAVLAAKQGLMGAAKRYLTLRSAMSILGPMLWGTLLAEMLISSVGTDYTRVVRAICALAQIRLMRSYHSEHEMEDFF